MKRYVEPTEFMPYKRQKIHYNNLYNTNIPQLPPALNEQIKKYDQELLKATNEIILLKMQLTELKKNNIACKNQIDYICNYIGLNLPNNLSIGANYIS